MNKKTGSLLFLDLILNEIPSSTKNILDIGCGTGELAFELAKRGYNVTGVDRDRDAIEGARVKHCNIENLHFQVCRAENLKDFFSEDNFDCVISAFALHHFDLDKFTRQVNNLVGFNGNLIIIDFFSDFNGSLFFSYFDQLLISHFRYFSSTIMTVRKIGLTNFLRFLIWRFRFAFSNYGKAHMYQDFTQKRLTPFKEITELLNEKLLLQGKVICGSIAIFSTL